MLDRAGINDYIIQNYSAEPEYPWINYPRHTVYRHQYNGKWFAVVMDIPKEKLGEEGHEVISVVNLKCDPILIGSFITQAGIHPGYHMNKANWITVCLNGSVEDEMIRWLLNMSFDLTKGKR